jgi:MFS family permease
VKDASIWAVGAALLLLVAPVLGYLGARLGRRAVKAMPSLAGAAWFLMSFFLLSPPPPPSEQTLRDDDDPAGDPPEV